MGPLLVSSGDKLKKGKTMARNFSGTRGCELWQKKVPHKAHDVDGGYRTVRYGWVQNWCQGYGEKKGLKVTFNGNAEMLPTWEYTDTDTD